MLRLRLEGWVLGIFENMLEILGFIYSLTDYMNLLLQILPMKQPFVFSKPFFRSMDIHTYSLQSLSVTLVVHQYIQMSELIVSLLSNPFFVMTIIPSRKLVTQKNHHSKSQL